MSEQVSKISQEWPTTPNLDDHVDYFAAALSETESRMWLPDPAVNPMWHIAQALLSVRGPKGSVLAMGEPGVGKTLWGDVVLGATNRVEVTSEHTLPTLSEGYDRPTDGGYNPGRIIIDPVMATIFLNEIAHLGDNSQAINALYETFILNNQRYNNTDTIAYYATGNHPAQGSRRSRPLDPALRSRQAMSLEVTMTPEEATTRNQQIITDIFTGKASSRDYSGLLPTVEASRALRTALQDKTRVNSNTGTMITNLTIGLRQLGVFNDIDLGDGRNAPAFANLFMARRLTEMANPAQEKDAVELSVKPKDPTYDRSILIAPYGLSTVAALRLGHIAELNPQLARGIESVVTDSGRLLTPSERSMFGRRIIAATAFAIARAMDPERSHQPANEAELRARIDRYSYVFPYPTMAEKMDEQVIKLVSDKLNPREFVK